MEGESFFFFTHPALRAGLNICTVLGPGRYLKISLACGVILMLLSFFVNFTKNSE